MKRQPRQIIRKIDAFIDHRSAVDSNELMAYVKAVIEAPEAWEMTDDYCRKLANNRIRSKRDEDGTRAYFSNGDKNNPVYINVETCTKDHIGDLRKALNINRQQKKRAEANEQKILMHMVFLHGQISLEKVMTAASASE